jgi:hypothetical protein
MLHRCAFTGVPPNFNHTLNGLELCLIAILMETPGEQFSRFTRQGKQNALNKRSVIKSQVPKKDSKIIGSPKSFVS